MSLCKHFNIAAACLIALALSINHSIAEEIRIPVGQQANDQQFIDMPSKGMHKAKVKALFGEPQEEVAATGQPPISRWRYQDFTVYFDSDAVIHSVRNFQPQSDNAE